ncbi:hypothetical protein COT42_03865 [Candidatus Saganbacteria bacterium CG08_land_8_20_14_0_20_45_16]|uniref:Flagellar basal body rod protein FlgB n=1 Tax=Candidatus Saganbacteria bacterium CG08_land_8_20_14_0_20_45_16 TaxID=2014293 RepID=A0A2H0Y0K6_UNCSA|nr:MAG: hypothetical protein COT42_03865 [Candidatus Saganbacteria bacterium CG08_land_8_20_14_0_20_45_16]
MTDLFGVKFSALERAMRIAAGFQEVTAQNVANAKTPGYEALTFDEELLKAVKRQDKKEVVLEKELATLTENSIKYSSYVKLLSSKINVLRTIATQGRR